MAFNYLALRRGADYVLSTEFDSVREFILRPASRAHRLPYFQRVLQTQGELSPSLERPSFAYFGVRRFEAIRVTIFVNQFLVDLRQPDQVVDLLAGTWPNYENEYVLFHDATGQAHRPDGSPIGPFSILDGDKPNGVSFAQTPRGPEVL